MSKKNLIDQAMRYALAAGAAAVSSHVAPALAANADQSPARLGKVEVTGSRIKRTEIETAQPITRIGRNQIQKSGYTNVGELLRQFSFNGATVGTRTYFNTGQNYVNLRNLGSNRTLVLVNGKRWLQGLGGSVNLNTIPTSIIDHIEVLQDGASAVYGSDAIAGVVNIITIKDFNGAEVHAHYGIHEADHDGGVWDGQTKQYDFTVGSGNNRGNVVFNATYREQNPIYANRRDITKRANFTDYPFSLQETGRFQLFGPAVSNRTIGQGHCGAYDPGQPTNALCDLKLINAPVPPSLSNFKTYQPTSGGYSYTLGSTLQTPLKDVSLYAQGHYDLVDNVTFTANAEYIRGESLALLGPEPLQIGLSSPFTAGGTPISISATNPYNPFGEDLVSDATDPCIKAGTCIGLNKLSRGIEEAGDRRYNYTRDNFHVFAGLKGFVNLLNREIDWDVGFAQNRIQQTKIHTGSFNTIKLAKALGPASQCTSPCVPINFFGGAILGDGGSITQKQLNYIGFEEHTINQVNLRDWTANISANDLYELPGGPLGLAVGWERLDNYGYFHPDSLKISGDTTAIPAKPTNGRVVTDAEYAELDIPLLKDLPAVKSLSIDIANRWSQFKRSGGAEGNNKTTFVHNSSGRLNIRWQPINDLLLRATWAQGFRAPNISSLLSGRATGFVAVTDPCAPYPGGYSGGPLPPNCPGGTPDIQGTGQLPSTGGGNPSLQPESSVSRTFGFVYSPSWLQGLDINADYFKIEINHAISTVGNSNIINGCFYNSTFCNLITVKGNQISDVLNVDTNVGGLLTEGADVGIHYKFPSTPFGDFSASIAGTFLKTFDITQVNLATTTGFATSHLAGITEQPKRRFNGYLNWDYGNWSAQYHIEYYGAAVQPCSRAFGQCTYPNKTADFQGEPGQFPNGRNHLGATVYHDINIGYTLPQFNTTLSLGVRNLFDKNAPLSRSGLGTFDEAAYRLPSRLVYGDVRVKF